MHIPQNDYSHYHYQENTLKYSTETYILWTRLLHHTLHNTSVEDYLCQHAVLVHNYLGNDDNDNSDDCELNRLIIMSWPIDRWSLGHITS